ncbi:uncharacterized protein LOC113310634 isoform X2 [Papaver somniferum]|uniref:uncharacterized protein LOC113310634 isoform X2 n=1 Tax=Papaver somniferum TaxID=3469 RepID=UPI000E704EB6|nr:uncharacterized protein LOC113310634 isoform X2 [Papaver somniferum]
MSLMEHSLMASSSSISSSVPVQETEVQVENQQDHQQQQNRNVSSVRISFTMISDWSSLDIMDDVWSCIIILLVCWFLVSVMVVVGFYGAMDLPISPNFSRLLAANPLFVSEIEVYEVTGSKQSPVLYGFYNPPPLDLETNWSESFHTSIPAYSHKEWIYYLNPGSEVDIMYSAKSLDSSPLFIVIAEGEKDLVEWIEDPSYPNTTLSWSIIQGSGRIQQKVFRSSYYYVAVANINPEPAEVQLNISIQAFLYNTSKAYYKCSLNESLCGLKLFPFKQNVAILSSPGRQQGTPPEDWFVKVSYEPRWITYFLGSGAMTLIFFLIYKVCAKFLNSSQNGSDNERTPLLGQKDDDILSLGSSYDSVSHDEEFEDPLPLGSTEGKQLKEGETENPHHLCLVCSDTARDSFFLPCGHCATCYTCGTRIIEEAGVCPVCRRKMKKLRRIIAV